MWTFPPRPCFQGHSLTVYAVPTRRPPCGSSILHSAPSTVHNKLTTFLYVLPQCSYPDSQSRVHMLTHRLPHNPHTLIHISTQAHIFTSSQLCPQLIHIHDYTIVHTGNDRHMLCTLTCMHRNIHIQALTHTFSQAQTHHSGSCRLCKTETTPGVFPVTLSTLLLKATPPEVWGHVSMWTKPDYMWVS